MANYAIETAYITYSLQKESKASNNINMPWNINRMECGPISL